MKTDTFSGYHPVVNFLYFLAVLVLSMFILGTIVLGKDFAMKTFLSSIVYPVYLLLIDPFVPVLDLDPMIASIYGGIVAGIGIGMVIRTGSSTGGMDIPPLIINKFFHIDVAASVLVIDALTVLLGLFTYGLEAVLIGLFSVATSSYVINMILTFGAPADGYSGGAYEGTELLPWLGAKCQVVFEWLLFIV